MAWVTTTAFYHPARRPPAEYDTADGGRATRPDRLGGVPRADNRRISLTYGLPAKIMHVEATGAALTLGSQCLRSEGIVFPAFFAKKAASSVRVGTDATVGVRGSGRKRRLAARRLLHEPLEPRMLLATGPLLITEFLAVNETGLTDDNGDHSDWIEIHNPTVAPINLDGWYLTDDDNALTKWRFPNYTLAADGYLVGLRVGEGPRRSDLAAAHELQARRRRRVPRPGSARRRDHRARVRPGVSGAGDRHFLRAIELEPGRPGRLLRHSDSPRSQPGRRADVVRDADILADRRNVRRAVHADAGDGCARRGHPVHAGPDGSHLPVVADVHRSDHRERDDDGSGGDFCAGLSGRRRGQRDLLRPGPRAGVVRLEPAAGGDRHVRPGRLRQRLRRLGRDSHRTRASTAGRA